MNCPEIFFLPKFGSRTKIIFCMSGMKEDLHIAGIHKVLDIITSGILFFQFLSLQIYLENGYEFKTFHGGHNLNRNKFCMVLIVGKIKPKSCMV